MHRILIARSLKIFSASIVLSGILYTAVPASAGMPKSTATGATAQRRSSRRATVRLIPLGTQLKVRLNNSISSKRASTGDRFTATVVNPSRYEGAKVSGHIARLRESGRVKGHTELVLAFDSVRLANGKEGPLHGQVTRIYDSESVQSVDEEGHIQSGGRGKQTLKRSGIGAVAGAVIGGIAGGGKGAAIGTIVGGAAGAGSIAIEGGKELKLESGTEMLVRVTSK